MPLTPIQERNLLKRLRFLSLLMLVFGAGFFTYSLASENEAPSPIEMETAGPDLAEMENAPPTQEILFAGSLVFCALGLATLFFASHRLKKHPPSH
jgi:Na+/phosphate symporter